MTTQIGHTPDLAAPDSLGIQLRRDVALAPYTTMKVGGPADYFATVTTLDQMIGLVRWAHSIELPYFILGGGSNMLVGDAGMRGLVIHNRCRQVRLELTPPQPGPVPSEAPPRLLAESGAAMAGVARQTIRDGLTGLEWAVSVPGTLGGAVVGNAGAHGGEIKDTLESALLLDGQGDVVDYHLHDLAYAYRDSSLKRLRPLQAGFLPVVLSATFRLAYGDIDEVRARAEGYLAHRRRTQPVEPSMGSTFVNPPGDYAGRLIELAGLKGRRVGGVEVSSAHANFLINPGGVGAATANDVMALIDVIRTAVHDRFGITLDLEIQQVGEW